MSNSKHYGSFKICILYKYKRIKIWRKVKMYAHYKSKLFIRYVISYLLIFLIPLTIMTLFFYQNASQYLRHEIEQSYMAKLKHSQMTIDNQLINLRKLGEFITMDKYLTKYYATHPYYGIMTVKSLDQYISTNSLIDEILLYFKGDNTIYSSIGSMSIDTLLQKKYPFIDWPSFAQDINSIDSPVIRLSKVRISQDKYKNMMVYMMPIPQALYPTSGIIVFMMEERVLSGLFESVFGDISNTLYLFDENKQMVSSWKHDTPIYLDGQSLTSISGMDEGIQLLNLEGTDYSAIAVKSDLNGWIYVSLIPQDQFFEKVAHIDTLLIIVIMITIVFGGIVAYKLAKQQYNPIYKLCQLAKTSSSQTDQEMLKARSNEWELLRQTVEYGNYVDKQTPYARNNFFQMLLQYGSQCTYYIDEMMSFFDISLKGGCCFVALMTWKVSKEDHSRFQQRQEVMGILKEMELSIPKAYIYGVELLQTDQIALIVIIPQISADEVTFDLVEQIISNVGYKLEEVLNYKPSFGIGNCYNDLLNIDQSYIEATVSLQYLIANSAENIIHFNNLPDSNNILLPVEEKYFVKLKQSIRQGNKDVAYATLNEIFSIIEKTELSPSLLYCIWFDIINNVLKAAMEIDYTLNVDQITDLTQMTSMEELKDKLKITISEICQYASIHEASISMNLSDAMIKYVEDNYADHDLSLESVADRFGYSVPYMSKLFKEKTGCTFLQYIWNLRMEEVTYRLTTSDDLVKDIVTQVGYLDVSNFIRRFKRETGLTPGQYRELKRANS